MKKSVLVSAGDAITAKLIEQAGFDGIWISGFEASARLGLADNGSITMTEMLNIARPIVDAVNIPVWVDVDTGYGNFQRTVWEFEKIGVAGVCIEDVQEGLKQNSLWGGPIPLMKKEDFADKIRVKRSKIKIMARTEALIRGYGKEECMLRLACYGGSGADILMPHTRTSDLIIEGKIFRADKVLKNTDDGKYHYTCLINKEYLPLAIVPTKFPNFSNEKLFNMGYSMVIWANQTERVKIKATRECLGSLKGSDCAEYIESHLSATLDEMKGLSG